MVLHVAADGRLAWAGRGEVGSERGSGLTAPDSDIEALAADLGLTREPGNAFKGRCPFCGDYHFWLNDRSYNCHGCKKKGFPTELQVSSTQSESGIDTEREHMTDLGNMQRLVRRYGSGMRYVGERGCWIVWDGKRWAPDKTGQVQRFAKDTIHQMHVDALQLGDRSYAKDLSKWAFQSESERRLNSMVSLARTEKDVSIRAERLDADPWTFNVQNGTIDLRTGELREHDPADLITKLAPVEFEPDAVAEGWQTFLSEVMGGRQDMVRFLQRAVGYSMTGDVDEHVLLFLYGKGANGKTTFLNALLNMFGEYGRQSEPSLLVQKRGESHPTGVADLKGARFVSTSEIDQGCRMAESLVKQLTGGDRIKARYMRQDFFEFDPSHTIWLAANHRPVVKGTDTAIWRRIQMIPFDVTIPYERRDPKLTGKLLAELPGILNWAIEGCLIWQREGLAPPEAVLYATKSYRTDMDTLGGFLSECCIVSEGCEVEAIDLYHRYKVWAEESGERKLAKNIFGQQLGEMGFGTKNDPKTRRVIRLGIGLNTGSEATRSNLHVSPLVKPHVERPEQVASGSFGTSRTGP